MWLSDRQVQKRSPKLGWTTTAGPGQESLGTEPRFGISILCIQLCEIPQPRAHLGPGAQVPKDAWVILPPWCWGSHIDIPLTPKGAECAMRLSTWREEDVKTLSKVLPSSLPSTPSSTCFSIWLSKPSGVVSSFPPLPPSYFHWISTVPSAYCPAGWQGDRWLLECSPVKWEEWEPFPRVVLKGKGYNCRWDTDVRGHTEQRNQCSSHTETSTSSRFAQGRLVSHLVGSHPPSCSEENYGTS